MIQLKLFERTKTRSHLLSHDCSLSIVITCLWEDRDRQIKCSIRFFQLSHSIYSSKPRNRETDVGVPENHLSRPSEVKQTTRDTCAYDAIDANMRTEKDAAESSPRRASEINIVREPLQRRTSALGIISQRGSHSTRH